MSDEDERYDNIQTPTPQIDVNGDGNITMPEFLLNVINPDMKHSENIAKLKHFFSKELKISNIERKDLTNIMEEMDLAWQTMELTPEVPIEKTFGFFRLMVRDGFLAASSSVDATERKLEVTGRQEVVFPKQKSGKLDFLKRKD